jgi:hypothetical protein
MDRAHFAALTHTFSTAPTRRLALRALALLGLGVLTHRDPFTARSKRGKKGKGKKKKRGNRRPASSISLPECSSPSECPGSDTECRARTCTSGSCGMAFVAGGTPVAVQIAGDCQVTVCDGSGGTRSDVDDTDLPSDEGNECTEDVCVNGTPIHPFQPVGMPCSIGHCNEFGVCVS